MHSASVHQCSKSSLPLLLQREQSLQRHNLLCPSLERSLAWWEGSECSSHRYEPLFGTTIPSTGPNNVFPCSNYVVLCSAGVRIRPHRCRDAFMTLAESSHYPVAIMPDAKGFFPQQYQRYMGLYWSVSCLVFPRLTTCTQNFWMHA